MPEDDLFPPKYRAAQQDQARQLMSQAAKAGLRFEAYLPPDDAAAVLAAVEKGEFLTPSELVWVAVQQFLEMRQHPDLQQELLSRELQKSLDDPSPGIPMEDVFAKLEAHMAEIDREQPAEWQDVGREFFADTPHPKP